MKNLVISGINLYQGGTLSIYYDCLDALIDSRIYEDYNVTAFVHKEELFRKYQDKITIIQLPLSRKSYLFRLYYEYIYFYFYSRKRSIDIWISIHDMTPNVKSGRLYTYCHNPTPFLKPDKRIKKFNKSVYYMSKFYKYLYRINIKRNSYVIVQQDWMRQEFKKMYHIQNIIVARPVLKGSFNASTMHVTATDTNRDKIFIYPAVGRPFKNFEIICEAAKELESRKMPFKVAFTIDGTENKYTAYLREKYGHLKAIQWIGFQSRDMLFEWYAKSDCMIFPSLLETWGLPISEYASFHKPMLLAELPYTHETVGLYDACAFFNPYSKVDLAQKMEEVILERFCPTGNNPMPCELPVADNWTELLQFMLTQ